jgi:hypothetical protein
MKNNEYSRRKFFDKCLGSGSMLFGAAVILNSCHSNKSGQEEKKQDKAEHSCDDFSDVSAAEMEKRQKFGYVKKSPYSDRSCGGCGLHIPPVSDKDCGGCLLFKGPVDPGGYCIQYVAKT